MPELPVVERGRKLVEEVAGERRITRVRCADDRIVYDAVTPARVRRALTGARVEAVRRRGKHLWLELDRAPHPLFHFGMTPATSARDTTARCVSCRAPVRSIGSGRPGS